LNFFFFFFFCSFYGSFDKIKSLDEPYIPGLRKWIKIKPDYLSGIGDTVDLVIIGAFYGEVVISDAAGYKNTNLLHPRVID
jgi:hypothetical protein